MVEDIDQFEDADESTTQTIKLDLLKKNNPMGAF